MSADQQLLTNAQWTQLHPLLPGYKQRGMRLFVEAVLWRAHHRAKWRDLPAKQFGRWHTVYTRARRWRVDDTWNLVLQQLAQEPELHRLLLDAAPPAPHVLRKTKN